MLILDMLFRAEMSLGAAEIRSQPLPEEPLVAPAEAPEDR